MERDCVFCKIAKGEIKSKNFVKKTNNFFAILDKNPKTKGHTLVIPKKHFVTLLDINNSLGQELLEFIKDVSSDMLEKKEGDGFNVVMNNLGPAGQVIQHAHIHIIPRKEGDGLKGIV